MKVKYTYRRYIAEPSGGEIFLTQKFNTQIIITAKISRSTVYNYMCTHTSYSPYSGEGATVSRPYRYSHGSEQQFTEEAYTVAPAEMEEQMTYDPENGQSTFPIAVLMETARNEGLGNDWFDSEIKVWETIGSEGLGMP